MSVRLRRFLYLDEALTSNFLAQLEGGIYDEESQTVTSGRGRNASAGAAAGPLHAGIGGSKSGENTTSRTVKQLADGDFARLVDLLEADNGVQWLESLDQSIWDQLRRGEVLEVEAAVSLPSIFQLTAMAGSAGPILELMRASGETIDQETEDGLQMVTVLGQLFKNPVALATPAGTSDYTFILELDSSGLRVEPGELTGEMIVFGTLERKLRDEDQWSLLDAMGLSALPNAQEMIESMEGVKDLEGSVVRPPAAVLKPVAIYR